MQSICDLRFFNRVKGSERRSMMRCDTTSQILSLSNVQQGSRALIIESSLGLLSAAVAQRLDGVGRVVSATLVRPLLLRGSLWRATCTPHTISAQPTSTPPHVCHCASVHGHATAPHVCVLTVTAIPFSSPISTSPISRLRQTLSLTHLNG